MPRVTDTAAAGAAVWVDVADARIGPGFRRGATLVVQLDLGAVALDAAGFIRRSAELGVLPPLVDGRQGMQAVLWNLLPVSAEMSALVELLHLRGVALTADGRRCRAACASFDAGEDGWPT